jgi:hypothetical protein
MMMGANGSESKKTALKVLTSCLMPDSFIVEAKPLECGSATAAFTAIANTGIRPKAAAALPHSKAPFGRSLAFDSHFRLHPMMIKKTFWKYASCYNTKMKITKMLIPASFFFLMCVLAFSQSNRELLWKRSVEKERSMLSLASFDTLKHEKAYRIWKNDYQVIELVKINDDIYQGQRVAYVYKINKKEEEKGILSKKFAIPDAMVKELMDKLAKENIEILPDSDDVKGYATGADGITYVFEISSNNSKRYYSYWEPEYQKMQA